jgi:hypothetical protein
MYPSSNSYIQGKHLISRLYIDKELSLKLRKSPIDEEKQNEIKKTITENEIYDFFQKGSNITHYDSNTIGKNLAEHFLGESLDFGILKKVTADSYLIELEGKKLDTVLKNYEKKYKEFFLKRKAQKKAYVEYRKKHPSLTDFN